MQKPELFLPDLNDAMRELLGAIGVLDDPEIGDQLLPIMRSLAIAEVLGNEYILAVGGSQGAGKTKLIRVMYDLHDSAETDWLKPNDGQGERYPVLVKESSECREAKGYLRKIDKDNDSIDGSGRYKLMEVAAKNIGEFAKACRGELPEVMLPILKVPRKFFQNDGQALLLLPGYEASTRENQEWQTLMRQALIGAAGCVIVTDQTRLADPQQRDIAKDVRAKELSASRPLVVVTKTEDLVNNQERLEELKQSAANIFKSEGDHKPPMVICTGSEDPEYVKRSMPELVSALKDMSGNSAELRQKQLTRLANLLKRDLTLVINLIRNRSSLFMHQNDAGDGKQQAIVNKFSEAFASSVKDLRDDYKNAVEGMLQEHHGRAKSSLNNHLKGSHEGFINKFKNAFDTFTETRNRLEEDVTQAWQSAGSLIPQHALLLDELTRNVLGHQVASPLPSPHVLQRLGYMDEKDELGKSKLTDPKVQANLAILLRSEVKSDDSSNEKLKETVALLPAMALEYVRVVGAFRDVVSINAQTPVLMPQLDVLASAQTVQTQVSQFNDKQKEVFKTVIKGMGAVLAVDFASDGKIDTIPALLNALGLGDASSADIASGSGDLGGDAAASLAKGAAVIGGTAATVVMSAVAVVGIAYIVHASLRQVQQHDEKVSETAHNMLTQIQEQHLVHFLSRFDDLMNKMRNHLIQGLHRRYKLDQGLMEQDRLAKALADVRVLQRDFLYELDRSGKTLQIFGNPAV